MTKKESEILMASYFNLVLDTLAPSSLTLAINDGAQYTTTQAVSLAIGLGDTDVTGYQIKIWGVDGAETESDASWQTYETSKSVTLTAGDGLKTVYVKVRDDVGNESAAVSDTITLDTAVPAVTVTGPDKSKISKVEGYNSAALSFVSDVDFVEYAVMVVPAISSLHAAGTQIGVTNGSENTSGTGEFAANTAINVTIKGADLEAASSGDGTKIVKVFVKNAAGTWSAA